MQRAPGKRLRLVWLTVVTSLLLAACVPAIPADDVGSPALSTPYATIAPEAPQPMIHAMTLGPANAYLIEAPEGLILIDTSLGVFANRIVEKIAALDKGPLCLIYITHAHIDHYGGANAIRAATGAPVAIHEADVEAMEAGETHLGTVRNWQWTAPWLPLLERLVRVDPTPADIVLHDGDAITHCGLAGEVVWTPGHTPGSSSLLVQMPESTHLFVGDLIANSSDPRIQRTYAQDWAQLLPSVRKVLALRPDYVHLGHGAEPLTLEKVEQMQIRGPASDAAP